MKKHFFLFACSILAVMSFAKAQTSTPTLIQLIKWVDESYVNFDKHVRAFGYEFEQKTTPKDGETNYVYFKMLNGGNGDRIIFQILKHGKYQQIQYVTTTTDLITYYRPQLTAKQFQTATCTSQDTQTDVNFCFKTSKHFVNLNDQRLETYGVNQYRMEIIQNKL